MTDDWKRTGVCPECNKRSICSGRCVMCGWLSDYRFVQERIMVLTERGWQRWRDNEDMALFNSRPRAIDWLLPIEKEEIRLLKEAINAGDETLRDIGKQVDLKVLEKDIKKDIEEELKD